MSIEIIVIALLWGSIIGTVFSSIGAAGGILASFGLISVIHVADPNSVKPMAQLLTLATALVFIPGYFRRQSWVLPLGLLLSAGGVLGALAGSTLSSRYLSEMSSFKSLFGVLAILVALQIGWKLIKVDTEKVSGFYNADGVVDLKMTLSWCSFRYGEQFFRFRTIIPLTAGFSIAVIASVFGVGGGFLLVPFMTSVLGLPMYIVPATAALAIFVSSATSVSNYLLMGSVLDIPLLLVLTTGSIAGAWLGPQLNQRLSERWLQTALLLIVSAIGLKYLLL